MVHPPRRILHRIPPRQVHLIEIQAPGHSGSIVQERMEVCGRLVTSALSSALGQPCPTYEGMANLLPLYRRDTSLMLTAVAFMRRK